METDQLSAVLHLYWAKVRYQAFNWCVFASSNSAI